MMKSGHKKRFLVFAWLLPLLIIILAVWIFGVRHGSLDFFPPSADATDVVAVQGERLLPSLFAANIKDNQDPASDIDLAFLEGTKPTTEIPGNYTVSVRLADKSGNERTLRAQLTVLPGKLRLEADALPKALSASDFVLGAKNASIRPKTRTPVFDKNAERYEYAYALTVAGDREIPCVFALQDVTPPVIEGAHDLEAGVDSAVLYREGVSVTDDLDPAPRLEIDSSAVNLSEPGRYPARYKAVDASENESSVTIWVNVLSAEEEWVFERADEILAEITTPDMEPRKKAYAVYEWVKAHMRYTAAPFTKDTIQGAYGGFLRGAGDCFNYYAVSSVLLTRAGIENMLIERIPTVRIIHYWNLVQMDGAWYHFDTCQLYGPFDGFLFTESQAQALSKKLSPIREHYFDYVKENYPQVAP